MTKNVRERFFFNQTLRPFLKLVVQRCSVKKMFLEISQISQENACARVSRDSRFRHRCLPVTLAKFLRIPFLTEHPWWLLLKTLHPIFFFFLFFFFVINFAQLFFLEMEANNEIQTLILSEWRFWWFWCLGNKWGSF